ncbi:MAG: glycosyltransferase, partial [Chloroflexota bacterium]
MASRLFAAAFLVGSIIVAWVTITVPLAARALQLGIAVSMAYVAWLAWRGARVMRKALAEARSGAGEPTGLADDLPFVSLIVPARNEAGVIDDTVRSLAALRYHRAGVPAYEVVVIDDGSIDTTGDAAREAVPTGAPIQVRRREPGSGPATKGAVLAFAMPFLAGD